jgi:hypothetical protein
VVSHLVELLFNAVDRPILLGGDDPLALGEQLTFDVPCVAGRRSTSFSAQPICASVTQSSSQRPFAVAGRTSDVMASFWSRPRRVGEFSVRRRRSF